MEKASSEGSAKHHVPVGKDNHPFYQKKKKGKRDRNEALVGLP